MKTRTRPSRTSIGMADLVEMSVDVRAILREHGCIVRDTTVLHFSAGGLYFPDQRVATALALIEDYGEGVSRLRRVECFAALVLWGDTLFRTTNGDELTQVWSS